MSKNEPRNEKTGFLPMRKQRRRSVVCAVAAHLRGGSNEYPQSLFWSKNKKNRHTPAYIKVGFKEVYISRTCYPDGVFVTGKHVHAVFTPSNPTV